MQSTGRTAARAEFEAARRLAQAALRRLDEVEGSEEALARVRALFEDRLRAAERRCRQNLGAATDDEDDTARILGEMVALQHEELQAMRRAGEIDTPTANRLQRRLDATERLRQS